MKIKYSAIVSLLIKSKSFATSPPVSIVSILLSASCFLLPTFLSAQSFTTLWTQISNPSTSSDDAFAITADASGIYVAGKDRSLGVEQWRIEKRALATGTFIANFGTAGVVTTGSSNAAFAITADVSGIYVAGDDMSPGPGNAQWRIEKRDLTTGALIGAFGTAGVVTSNPSNINDTPYAITADASGIYVAGQDGNNADYQWRVEKRDLTTGALIAAFGTAGVITSNPSAGFDMPFAITADASGIYVAGSDNSFGGINDQWRIEKRDLTTGALIAAFGTAGVVTSHPSAGEDFARAITADASGIYVTGQDNSPGNDQWRIEKRDLTTGALIGTFGTAGVVTSDPSPPGYDFPNAITIDASGIYIAGMEFPGNEQWRIEKWHLTTGTLLCTITSNLSGIWNTARAITSDASGIYVAGKDGNGGYQWRIEKYNLCNTILSVNASQTNLLCYNQCIGTATATPAGGINPYTYTWNNGQTTSAITGLCTGNYWVTVTDFLGNTTTASVTITQPSPLNLNTSSTLASCTTSTGATTANPSGGTPAYNYNWSNGQTTPTATGLSAGTYTVTVTDANGCMNAESVTIQQILALTTELNNTTCDGFNDGSATVNPLDGTAPYTFAWSNGQITQTIAGLDAGSYVVTVIDANGCLNTTTVTVNNSSTKELYLPNAFSPNSDGENDVFCLQESMKPCIEKLKIIIYNRWGEKVFKSTDPKFCWDALPASRQGTNRDNIMNTAVFVYYLEATFIAGGTIVQKGNISLIR